MSESRVKLTRCPRCNSSAPHMHPATAFEGEVIICSHDYHLTPTPQNSARHMQMVRERRNREETADV